jgi:hypothetical protein
MRLIICVVSAGLAFAVIPGSGLAGQNCEGFDVATHIFEASDIDGSGTLSREEYAGAGLERYGVPFEDYDANGDGETSRDEYFDLYDRHHLAEGEIES